MTQVILIIIFETKLRLSDSFFNPVKQIGGETSLVINLNFVSSQII